MEHKEKSSTNIQGNLTLIKLKKFKKFLDLINHFFTLIYKFPVLKDIHELYETIVLLCIEKINCIHLISICCILQNNLGIFM